MYNKIDDFCPFKLTELSLFKLSKSNISIDVINDDAEK